MEDVGAPSSETDEHAGSLPCPPPSNYGMVVCGVYRSGFPNPENFEFLVTLKLRSIVYLCEEEYPEKNKEFARSHGIEIFHFGIESNKDPSRSIPLGKVMQGLEVLINAEKHPILIHCNSGKHRTGCLVASYRKLRKWDLSSVINEYRLYSSPKERVADLRFIEKFDRLWFIRFMRNRLLFPHQYDSS